MGSNEELIDGIRNKDISVVGMALESGNADPNLYIYGYIIEDVIEPDIIKLMIEFGAKIEPENFTRCSSLAYVHNIIKTTDNEFWYKAYIHFFPNDEFFPHSDSMKNYNKYNDYQTLYTANCIKLEFLIMNFIDIKYIKSIYNSKYYITTIDEAFGDHLILWDIVKGSEFSFITVEQAFENQLKDIITTVNKTLYDIEIEIDELMKNRSKTLDKKIFTEKYEDVMNKLQELEEEFRMKKYEYYKDFNHFDEIFARYYNLITQIDLFEKEIINVVNVL